jgi:hypothetical protein
MLPIKLNQKNAKPANGLNPSLAKATAGIIKIRKGITIKKSRKIAKDIGRKYIAFTLV